MLKVIIKEIDIFAYKWPVTIQKWLIVVLHTIWTSEYANMTVNSRRREWIIEGYKYMYLQILIIILT